MYEAVLYIHMASAAAWIGGSMLLFVLGITLRDKEAQKMVYFHIGPLYGYFESIVLALLLLTGSFLYVSNGFHDNPEKFSYELGFLMHIKIGLVILITIATIAHMKVSLEANGREKTFKEKIIARGTSMGIFLLNFAILWLAMQVREIL
jgi:putative copper export protein